MEFESMKLLLQSQDLEEVQSPPSSDIFNIFCKKDGDYINTIQVLEGTTSGQRTISTAAQLLLERAIASHRIQHQVDYHVSLYEDVSEPAFKSTS